MAIIEQLERNGTLPAGDFEIPENKFRKYDKIDIAEYEVILKKKIKDLN